MSGQCRVCRVRYFAWWFHRQTVAHGINHGLYLAKGYDRP